MAGCIPWSERLAWVEGCNREREIDQSQLLAFSPGKEQAREGMGPRMKCLKGTSGFLSSRSSPRAAQSFVLIALLRVPGPGSGPFCSLPTLKISNTETEMSVSLLS